MQRRVQAHAKTSCRVKILSVFGTSQSDKRKKFRAKISTLCADFRLQTISSK
uniref:Uncharacterized protein n=1 Tax=Arundo donax TaxID=35708 RepID=A0A0A9D8D9_ARUDO